MNKGFGSIEFCIFILYYFLIIIPEMIKSKIFYEILRN